jgi:transposase
MQVIHQVVAGLDIHKQSVTVCVLRLDSGQRQEEVRTYNTMTRSLLELREWLLAEQVEQVGMEATGVYWKPIWNLLEGDFELLLANPTDLKRMPGRKTDVADCVWLAELLCHGLVAPSFVPDRPQRELRDLTRLRAALIEERTRVSNRLQKVLEDANIKLASVASDPLGVSGRAMLAALVAGEQDPQQLAELAQKRLRHKRADLVEAFYGAVNEHHRFLLELQLGQLGRLEQEIEAVTVRLETLMRPFEELFERLDPIPGIGRQTIEVIVSELGVDMSRFPSAAHAASWAGLAPGNNESGGRRRRSRTRRGNQHLKHALVQAAQAAARTKGSYLASLHDRLVSRLGKQRTIVAVAHALLEIIYHLLSDETQEYRDLGADYFYRRHQAQQAAYYTRRLAQCGYEVTLTPLEEVA